MPSPANLTRRGFSSLLLAGIASGLLARKRIRNALQLFSVRTECERNLPQTLHSVRRLGYEGVEFAGFYGWRSAEVREFLNEANLAVCGSHTPLQDLMKDRFAGTVAFNREIGNQHLIVPGLPPEYYSPQGWTRAAELFNEISESLQPFGMRVGYHNHDVEFKTAGGKTLWDMFAERTSASVILQLDLGNARLAGVDPIQVLREHPGRAWSIHVKDCLPGEPDVMLGTSGFKWHELCRVCRDISGTEWYILEHESKTRPGLAAAGESLKRFQALRRSI
jgi:sugar phosphate isomerase/epimerase